MTDHLTDSATVTITVVEHGNVSVTVTDFPTQVFVDEPFDILYDVTNNGGADDAYGQAMLEGTPIAGSRWDELIAGGATVSKSATVVLTVTGPNDIIIEVGYVD